MLDMCELPLRVATGCDQDEERDACDDPQCVARETFIVTQPGGPACKNKAPRGLINLRRVKGVSS